MPTKVMEIHCILFCFCSCANLIKHSYLSIKLSWNDLESTQFIGQELWEPCKPDPNLTSIIHAMHLQLTNSSAIQNGPGVT